MAYSIDLRKKVIEYLEAGQSQRETRATFHICMATINKWNQQYKKTGTLEDARPVRKPKKLEPEKLIAYVQAHPDAYQKEIAEAFDCTDAAIRKAFKRLGITRKKRQRDIESKTPVKQKSTFCRLAAFQLSRSLM